jgi:hypothetical protein
VIFYDDHDYGKMRSTVVNVLRAQNKMAAFLLKFYTGGALPFSQTTGNLKMELSGDIACVGQKI